MAIPLTHYVAAFCRRRGDRERAVCGEWTFSDERAPIQPTGEVEPTCPRCQAWLVEDARIEASMVASFGNGPEDPDADERTVV